MGFPFLTNDETVQNDCFFVYPGQSGKIEVVQKYDIYPPSLQPLPPTCGGRGDGDTGTLCYGTVGGFPNEPH